MAKYNREAVELDQESEDAADDWAEAHNRIRAYRCPHCSAEAVVRPERPGPFSTVEETEFVVAAVHRSRCPRAAFLANRRRLAAERTRLVRRIELAHLVRETAIANPPAAVAA